MTQESWGPVAAVSIVITVMSTVGDHAVSTAVSPYGGGQSLLHISALISLFLTNEPICKTEIESQMWKTYLW